jgi:hypothetical protein
MDDIVDQYAKTMENYIKTIESHSPLSRREILIRLGDSILNQDSVGFASPTIKQCTDAGKKYFADNYQETLNLRLFLNLLCNF